ncbi:MAG: hypothetical protein L0L63_02370 [Staphylococcus equorum]|uniref:hypothetical protein n=1 Tax=Staphylococcus TaxID=1279 RepID=UPI0025556F93|nr:hypothetical protein [Staphylococcus equorum]MDK9870656.1 hypothetical protein [Staphylococcus equorum]MDK9876054.1 hypothetical protein [Staphylococcus equorum]MDN6612703.1 hypothetical protein [Staphylococcus equorum]MDN6741264.1 hypothetical protein [Staphylococcus equorum]
MKIKRKVQKTLPQLIEWAKENDIKNKIFIGKQNYYNVGFDIHGFIYFNSGNTMPLDETFTVTTEEEIDEDTEFKSMVEVTTDDLFAVWEHASISTWKNEHSKEFHAYIDGEFKLIWTHEKGLVE